MKKIQIAKQLRISPTMVSLLASGQRKISYPLAEKLSELFGGSEKEWRSKTWVEVEDRFNSFTYCKTVSDTCQEKGGDNVKK